MTDREFRYLVIRENNKYGKLKERAEHLRRSRHNYRSTEDAFLNCIIQKMRLDRIMRDRAFAERCFQERTKG